MYAPNCWHKPCHDMMLESGSGHAICLKSRWAPCDAEMKKIDAAHFEAQRNLIAPREVYFYCTDEW